MNDHTPDDLGSVRPASRADVPAATPATDWRSIAALFLGSQLLIWIVAGVSLHLAPKGPFFTPPATMADWFVRWDATWYLGIAEHGYYFGRAGEPTNVVFFPLFPLLTRIASLGGLVDLKIAGHVVSLGCLGTACVWLWRAVAREWRDARLATLAVAFVVFCPVALFFSIPYSEGLFLMLAIGCIDSARRGRWWLAGGLGALAALTRFIGVMFVVPLLWQYWENHRRSGDRLRNLRLTPLLACLLPLAGMALYCGFMWVKFGDALIYFHGQEHWGRRFSWFWLLFARQSFSGQSPFYQVWFFASVMSALGLLALGVWRRMPVVYAIYGLAFGFIYISSRFVEAQPRFFSVIFPLYVALALIATHWPKTKIPLLVASAALQAMSVVLFVNGYWFT